MALSLIIILNHPYLRLDWIPNDVWWGWYLRVIIHEPNSDWPPFTGLYPIIPWVGVMGLGWVFGGFLSRRDRTQIADLKAPLTVAGVASVALFFVVRWVNGYGNLLERAGDTAMDWLYVSKYPPSLAFFLWTLGGMCLLMALGLHWQGRPKFSEGVTGAILVFGRNPLFFYLTHLWLYRFRLPGAPRPMVNLSLVPTLLFWLVGLVLLWRLCIWSEGVKRAHPDSLLKYI
jgi:uncharacterized membrane protein